MSRKNRWYLSTSLSYEDDVRFSEDENDKILEIESRNQLTGAGIIWDSRRNHLKSFSPSDGRLATLTYETSALTNSTNKGHMLIADWREFINLDKLNVLGIRITSGLGISSPRNFELGGNAPDESVFQQSMYSSVAYRTKIYNKRRYPLRGYETGTPELIGRRMLMINAEWRFPIANIERGFPVFPLGLNQLFGTLFYNGASVWNSGLSPQRFHHGLGIEMNADTQWFIYFPVRWRLGVATGLSDAGENQLYLSIGSNF